jgi:hypothetical protein
MNAVEDYCELCDLPRSTCIHGRPPPPEPTRAAATPTPRKRAPRKTTKAAAAKPVTRRWTPPEAFKPLILAVLEDAGGELDGDDVFREIEVLAADRLRPEDSETTPEGELRWRYAVRRARVALMDEGLMTKGTPGLWQLA